MTSFSQHDINVLEGDEDSDEMEQAMSLQRAINSGFAWSFQGSYGRTMMAAIEAGRCMLGTSPARDYYGNYIPSRSQVQEGTKGSRQFVVDRMGEEWAVMLEGA